MKKILITGCGGLIGLESTYFFLDKGFEVLGVDNNMRSYFFGDDGSVKNNLNTLSIICS
jgi:CDP-paratose 2-epimerase